MATLCMIDDKHIPLHRIIWVSDVPHFCGSDECQREGQYEVRLEQDETVWANDRERDALLEALRAWGEPEGADDDCRE